MAQSVAVGGKRTIPEQARSARRAAEYRRRLARAPVVIEADAVYKRFRIPMNRILSLKERAARPFAKSDFREIDALHDVSFDIHAGEFFGIVGRNGSGKSTLLKILASIYKADSGTIRMRGRPAPFIELGVGFDQELAAHENVVLNGVMMGLTRKEARQRVDSVLDFAELRDFAHLKMKNYSSGMLVRLAFSVMIHSPDTDILLIDEVLAVGDAAFQAKCAEAFRGMRKDGRTVVLVTHDMNAVAENCDRAMAIHDGAVTFLGDPDEASKEYLRLNFESATSTYEGGERYVPGLHARVIEAWLEGEGGERIPNVEAGQPIRFTMIVEASDEWFDPIMAANVFTIDGTHVLGLDRMVGPLGTVVAPGQRVRLSGMIDNPLAPGRYVLQCGVSRRRSWDDVRAVQGVDALSFLVYGPPPGPGGLISGSGECWAAVEDGRDA
jgi:ABC-type polysaccharide/polyol phosphate transport system ATPase subunit